MQTNIERVFEDGLHEFITEFVRDLSAIGAQIDHDYRFLG
jgi:uncharacterized alpha-E superfamily protein